MSEKQVFTKGPWHPGHLGDPTTTCECAHVVDEGHAGGICTIHIDNGKRISDGGNDAPSREEAIGNMHLIAAAPDMFEALPDLSHVISWLENGCDPLMAAKELRIYQSRIDAALTRATGGQADV